MTTRTFKVKPSTAHERFGDETVILNLESGSYYSAGGTGSAIWALVGDGASEAHIQRRMVAEYSGDGEEISRATTEFLDQLVEESLVEAEIVPDGVDGPQANGAGPSDKVFVKPLFQKYTDMEEMLLLDPIHEVDEQGWPHAKEPQT